MNWIVTRRIAICAVLLTACSGLSDSERQTVRTWLLCDECAPTDLTRVTSLGNAAVPMLDTALRQLPQDREELRRTLIQTYARISPIPATEAEYVARHLGNFDALVQIRAAIALGEIDTPRSRDALRRAVDSAEARGYRPDVLARIEQALASAQYTAFAGGLEPDTVAFLDTIVVSRGTGLGWSGDESLHVTGAPFPDDFLLPPKVDTIKFLAATGIGTHAAIITKLGTGADTQVAQFVVTRIPYRPHAPAAALNIATAPFPLNPVYFALAARPGDTTDHFRFAPAVPITVQATVSWTGVSPLSLSWHACSAPHNPRASPAFAIVGRIIDEQGLPVELARVEVLGTSLSELTSVSGEFVLPYPAAPVLVPVMVTKIGYRPTSFTAQRGAHLIMTLLPTQTTSATARSTARVGASIVAGACWLLRVMGRSASGVQFARLRFPP